MANRWEAGRDAPDCKENKAGQTVVSRYGYAVNGIGQRTGVATGGTAFQSQPAGWAWGYDALGQVVSGDSPVNTLDRTYRYDRTGNRIEARKGLTVPTGTANYAADALNQYTKAEDVALPVSPPPAPYDDDGNLRFDGGVNKDNQPRQYLRDAEWRPAAVADMDHPQGGPQGCRAVGRPGSQNRLAGARVADGATLVTYSHDAFGRRVSRTAGTSTTLFLHDGWNVVAEYASTATSFEVRTIHTWGLDLSGRLQGAGGVGGLLATGRVPAGGSPADAAWYYPTYDGNGNISEYLDSSGAPVAHYEYDPFGDEITLDGRKGGLHDAFSYRFSTKPFDDITGWYYYGFRHYIPVTGRWACRDPIEEEGGINLYGFVGNAPIRRVDIIGLKTLRLQFYIDGSVDTSTRDRRREVLDIVEKEVQGVWNALNRCCNDLGLSCGTFVEYEISQSREIEGVVKWKFEKPRDNVIKSADYQFYATSIDSNKIVPVRLTTARLEGVDRADGMAAEGSSPIIQVGDGRSTNKPVLPHELGHSAGYGTVFEPHSRAYVKPDANWDEKSIMDRDGGGAPDPCWCEKMASLARNELFLRQEPGRQPRIRGGAK